jgi:hypothetical protein
MPPKSQRTLSKSRDDYAAVRCACKHLRYAGWQPGDPCLAAVAYDPPRCQCTDHRPKAGAGGR